MSRRRHTPEQIITALREAEVGLARGKTVAMVSRELGSSERHACRVLGQPRTTQRRVKKVQADEVALRTDVVRLASRFGRYGYRQITNLLRIEGWEVNHKRVERIWRQEGLKVPRRQPKRGRLWLNDGSCIRLRPLHKNHVWSYDFVSTRQCLAIKVGRKTRAHAETGAEMAGQAAGPDPLHRAGQSVGERLQRELQRQTERRVLERRDLLHTARGCRPRRAVEAAVQYRPTTQRLGRGLPPRPGGGQTIVLVP